MKIREGFVSNSSSSSFIISSNIVTKNEYTVDSIYYMLEELYISYCNATHKKEISKAKRDFKHMLYVVEINKNSDRKKIADDFNRITSYGFNQKTIQHGIWIISNGDNTIPYDFIDKIRETFKWEYKFLG